MDNLPNELVESIVTLLALEDIRSLRLTCRTLAAQSTQDHFKTFFRAKQVDLTPSQLTGLVEATARPLGRLVENVIVTGVVNNPKGLEELLRTGKRWVTERHGPIFSSTQIKCEPDELVKAERNLAILRKRQAELEEFRRSGRDLTLLAQAFDNIATHGRAGGLKSLSLRIVVFRDDAEERLPPPKGRAWKLVWRCAALTFQTVFNALAASELSVESLSIFNDEHSKICSIARNEVSQIDFSNPGITRALAAVKSLSISLSDRVIDGTEEAEYETGDPAEIRDYTQERHERDIEVLRAEASHESNFSGFGRLIAACSQVEYLDFHYRQLSTSRLRISDIQTQRLLQTAVEPVDNRRLRLTRCRLRGLRIREQDLLKLLKAAPIRDLTLEEVHLCEGTWDQIFSYCSSEEAGMRRLYFDDVFGRQLVYFDDEPGRPKFPSTGRVWGSNTLEREGSHVGRPIVFHFSGGHSLGSSDLVNWLERRRTEYGQP